MHRLLLALALALGVVPLTLHTAPAHRSLDTRPAAETVAAPFTIAVIPDTRGYSTSDELAATARAQTQWVVDRKAALDIAFTVQLGDLVQDRQDPDQWARISDAFATLDTNDVPYAVVPGDHDTDLDTGDVTEYAAAFPSGRFGDAAWNTDGARYGGARGASTFDLFTAGGEDWLLLNLELEAPDDALAWAQQVLDDHPTRRVILTTHSFLDTRGWRNDAHLRSDAGTNSSHQVWNEFVQRNCSIDFVLSAHAVNGDLGEGRRTDPNACGEPVQQLSSDYADRPDGGDGWLRYYTFDAARSKVDAFTYSVTRHAFENDADSRFTLPYDAPRDPADQVVVPGGSTWSWRHQQGDWPTAWDTTTYDDSAWSSGPAPLGFGSGMVRTDVDLPPPTTNRATSLLFRRTFDLDDVPHVSRLRLVTKADDGLVIRVNGQEVGRTSVPTGPVGPTTKATAAPRSMAAQQVVYDVPLCLLKPTGNVIAASVHLSDVSTTDAHFDLAAVATRSAEATPPAPATVPQNVTLVAPTAPWRWRFSTSAWPTGWTTPTFADSTWSQGAAPLGFGATVGTNIDVPAPTSNRPRSALFRRTFEIDDVTKYSGLQLSSRADDGVLLTVNGTEVNRTRLPTGTLSASSYATSVVTTSAATASPVTVSIPASLLRNGTNVIAAATVLNYKGTPNATFAAGLTAVRATPTTGCGSAPAAPTLRVDSTTPNEVRLGWGAGSGVTRWTLTRGRTTIAQLPGSTTSYVDAGLTPGTAYSYSLTATTANGTSTAAIVNATTTAAGEPVTLLASGSAWRYQFVATWPTGWSANGFDDAAWKIGPAPLGFGSTGVATNIDVPAPTSNRPRSALLRASFDVADRTRLSNLVVTTRADDGVVVYVNGQEVGRSNVPTVTVTPSTYANAAPRTTAAAQNPVRWTVPSSVLKDGPNTVAAVSLLNYKGTPDLSFDLSLTASQSAPVAPPAPVPGTCGSPAPFAPTCGVLWGIYTIDRRRSRHGRHRPGGPGGTTFRPGAALPRLLHPRDARRLPRRLRTHARHRPHAVPVLAGAHRQHQHQHQVGRHRRRQVRQLHHLGRHPDEGLGPAGDHRLRPRVRQPDQAEGLRGRLRPRLPPHRRHVPPGQRQQRRLGLGADRLPQGRQRRPHPGGLPG